MSSLPQGQGPYQSGNPITLEALFVYGTTPVDPDTVVFNLRTPTTNSDVHLRRRREGHEPDRRRVPLRPADDVAAGADLLRGRRHQPRRHAPRRVLRHPLQRHRPRPAPGPQMPPCTSWLAGEDLVGLLGSTDLTQVQLDAAAVIASMLGFECFGRRWTGLCGPVTVRPCQQGGCGEGYAGWGGLGGWW